MLGDLSAKFPKILDRILSEVDDTTLASVRLTDRQMNHFLEHDSKLLWYRMLNKHTASTQEFDGSWTTALNQETIARVREISMAVGTFFKGTEHPPEAVSARRRIGQQVHPLHVAAWVGSLELCTFLVNKTGDVNPKRAGDGATPLLLAGQAGHLEVYRYLSASLEDKNPPDTEKWTPLHSAAQNGHLDVVKFILATLPKAKRCPRDKDGWTPMRLAAQEGHTDVVRHMMESLSYEDVNPATAMQPLDIAAGHYVEMVLKRKNI